MAAHSGSRTFIATLTESRIAGFDKKLAAQVKERSTIEKDDAGFVVRIRETLDGKKLKKPHVVSASTKPEAIKAAGDWLLQRLHDDTPEGVPVMLPVESSNIAAIGFSEEEKALYVKFVSGIAYRYLGVPKSKAIGIMDAASHGKYLAEEIKDRFDYEKLS